MKYHNYDIEELVLDESFRKYCLGTDAEAVRFWEELLLADNALKLRADHARKLFFTLNGGVTAAVFEEHRRTFEAELVKKGIMPEAAPVIKMSRGRRLLAAFHRNMGVAASIAAVVIVTFLLNHFFRKNSDQSLHDGIVYSSNAGEKKSFQLPDGTKVILNGKSNLRLAKTFNKEERRLDLEGEAFFDVVHNPAAPFVVHTLRFDIKVLGTAFNVRAYSTDNKSVAALIRGQIELSFPATKKKNAVLLKANEQLTVEDEMAVNQPQKAIPVIKKSNPGAFDFTVTPLQLMPDDSAVIETSWTENRLVFYDESFEEVARKIERWFGIEVRFEQEDIKQYRYTGTFDKENLKSVIDALKLSKPFSYRFANERLLVLTK